jgi:hypothetical protein
MDFVAYVDLGEDAGGVTVHRLVLNNCVADRDEDGAAEALAGHDGGGGNADLGVRDNGLEG